MIIEDGDFCVAFSSRDARSTDSSAILQILSQLFILNILKICPLSFHYKAKEFERVGYTLNFFPLKVTRKKKIPIKIEIKIF